MHHNTDLWGHAVPIDQGHSGIWPMGGAWRRCTCGIATTSRGTGSSSYARVSSHEGEPEFLLDYMVEDRQVGCSSDRRTLQKISTSCLTAQGVTRP